MRKTLLNKHLAFTAAIILFFPILVFPAQENRYFDTAAPEAENITLTLLCPSSYSLRSLFELRNKNLLNVENLTAVGVFHEKERTDYKKSAEFVAENNIDWIKFHKLSGDICIEDLFRKNDMTVEFKKIFSRSDGIIFFGGADIPPAIYKERTNLLTHIATPYRHYLETSFVFHLFGGFQDEDFVPLLKPGSTFPVLGLCLGMQSLNVGTGGTMVQDIWSEIYRAVFLEDVISLTEDNWHTNPYARLFPEEKLFPYKMHPISLKEAGKFVSEFGFKDKDKPLILSAHHQMIEKLGKGIEVIATSLDGKVVEAIAHKAYPNVLGVQFHPEFPVLYDKEKKHRFAPQDKEEKSILTILKENPPSLDFHKKIWSWFSKKLTGLTKD